MGAERGVKLDASALADGVHWEGRAEQWRQSANRTVAHCEHAFKKLGVLEEEQEIMNTFKKDMEGFPISALLALAVPDAFRLTVVS